jgi:hypothetical protein
MARLDDFTLNVLGNAEVIDVNQDLLGQQARIVRKTAEEFILAKPLQDGNVAVGLFNLTGASGDRVRAKGTRGGRTFAGEGPMAAEGRRRRSGPSEQDGGSTRSGTGQAQALTYVIHNCGSRTHPKPA